MIKQESDNSSQGKEEIGDKKPRPNVHLFTFQKRYVTQKELKTNTVYFANYIFHLVHVDHLIMSLNAPLQYLFK